MIKQMENYIKELENDMKYMERDLIKCKSKLEIAIHACVDMGGT